MDKQTIELCKQKQSGAVIASWDAIAEQRGYPSGENLRSAWKRYRKRNGQLTPVKVVIKQPLIECETVSKKPRLVISDLHLPFAVEGWLDFIKATHKKYDCDEEIIINGDLIDFHSYSRFTTETDAMSGIEEFDKAKEMISELVKAFPKVKFLLGNHDSIVIRRVRELGIDKRFTKTFHEMFELPKTWEICEEIIIDDVYYRHQGSCGGKTGAINSAIANRMSTVVSHLHADGGVAYAASPNGDTIFGINSGALVDDKAYAFRYGTFSRFKSTIGCAVIVNSKEAHFIPMVK